MVEYKKSMDNPKARPLTSEDYETFSKWLKLWGWPEVPAQIVMPATGLVVENEGIVHLLYTNSGFMFLIFPVANPELSKERREITMDYLFKEAEKVARMNKSNLLMTFTGHPGVASRCERLGWKTGDTNTTHYARVL